MERKGWWFAPPPQTFLLPSGQLCYSYTAIKQQEACRKHHRLRLLVLRELRSSPFGLLSVYYLPRRSHFFPIDGGEGGSRTHVRNTFSRQFTTINQLEIVALFVRLMTFVAVQREPCTAH